MLINKKEKVKKYRKRKKKKKQINFKIAKNKRIEHFINC